MSCFRFFDTNFVDQNILANFDVSSEQAAFPLTNAFNAKRRAKVWRSDGYYVVTSTNNVIIFRESIGVDLTATIATGQYTRAQFFSAIKAALELTGASTYTVTLNANLKVNIASNGAGGGGIFQLAFDDVLSTAKSLLVFDSVELTGALNYSSDSINIHSEEWILFDLGIDSNPTGFMMIDARNRPITISPTATVLLQGNHTNVWTSPVFSQQLDYNDNILQVLNKDGIADEALRYWRVKFIDQNPLGYIQVGAFYLGGHYETTRGAPQFPFRNEPIDRTETIYSEGGQTFSEIKPKTEKFTTEWFALTVDEKERFELIFDQFGLGVPFFISFDSVGAFSSEVPYYIRYVKFSNEPSFELVRPGIYRTTTTFEEQL